MMNDYLALQMRSEMYHEDALHECANISAWWSERGFPGVQTWAEEARGGNAGTYWIVRSNLVNGLPHGADPKTVARLYQWGGK